ncbi:MAG: NUDIX hydrolase [Acidimicrobiales bacterium]
MTARQRTAGRVIVRDRSHRLLMLCGTDPHQPGRSYWITAGGGLGEGETFEQAAARELFEETGIVAVELGAVVHSEQVEFSFESVSYQQSQHFFAVEVPFEGPDVDLRSDGWEDYERRSIKAIRWWEPEQLASTGDEIYPPTVAEIAASVGTWGQADLPA